MKFFLTLILLYVFPQIALADNGGVQWFTPVPGDLSIQYLGNIFGMVDGVLHSSGSQMMGVIFGVFNSAMLTLGGIIIIYTLFVGTLRTAHEGEVLGKQWSSIWIPIRTVSGFALLLPKASGYSLIQIFVMWVVVQGVGAADNVWTSAVKYLVGGGSLVQVGSSGLGTANQGVVGVAGNIMKMEACTYALTNALQQYAATNPSQNVSVSPFIDTITVYGNVTGATPPCYHGDTSARCQAAAPSPGNYDTGGVIYFPDDTYNSFSWQGQPSQFSYKGACGQLAWPFATQADGFTPDMNSGDSRTSATLMMINALKPQANGLANAIMPPPGSLIGQTTAQQLAQWAQNYQNNLVVTATDYIAARQPYMEALSTSKAQLDGDALYTSTQTNGWILAGSYYTTLASNYSSSTKLQTEPASTWTYGAKSPSLGYAHFANPPFVAPITESQRNALNGDQEGNPQTGLTSNSDYSNVPLPSSTSPFACNKGNSAGSGMENIIDCYIANEQIVNYVNATNTGSGSGNPSISGMNIISSSQKTAGIAGLTPLLPVFPIGTIVGSLMMGMVDVIVSDVRGFAGNDVEPIAQISALGFDLLNWAQSIWIVTTVGVFVASLYLAIGSCMGSAWQALMVATTVMMPMVTAVLLALVGAGAAMAYYVPIIPFVMFLFTAIGWFIAVIEAMIAAPLVALGIAHPEGQHEILGRAEPAIMLLAGVFMRPALIVIGFLAASILVRISLWLFNHGFVELVAQPHEGASAGGVFALAAAMLIYVWIVMEIIERCFSLIHEIPSRVLMWVGGQIQSYGEAEAVRAVKGGVEGGFAAGRGAMEAGTKAAEGAGSSAGKAAHDAGKGIFGSIGMDEHGGRAGGVNPKGGVKGGGNQPPGGSPL